MSLQHQVSFPFRVVRKLLRMSGFELKRLPASRKENSSDQSAKLHQSVTPYATYSPWAADSDFLAIFHQIKDHTLVDIYRCYELWTLAKQTQDVEGDILEVGVWRGGTGAILAKATQNMPNKTVFLADTFSGVVKAGDKDTSYLGGEHADTSVNTVKDLLTSLSLTNTQILQGIFPEESHTKVTGKIAMLHCDVDVYQSSKDIVDWCLPRLTVGAVMVFDDFGFASCEGVTTFCEELRAVQGFRFLHNLNGHAVFVKVTH